MINLSEINAFVKTADELSFSKAAKRLHLSQSAVSHNILTIEKAFEVTLFHRQGRSIQLTEVGKQILPAAKELLLSAEYLEDKLRNATKKVQGNIFIGCSTTTGNYLTPILLAAFQTENPIVKTSVTMDRNSMILQSLSTQDLDIAFIGREVSKLNFESIKLFDDLLILVVPSDHPWANRKFVDRDELYDQPFIKRENTSGSFEILNRNLLNAGIDPNKLNIVSELGDAEAVLMAVENGIGITFTSELTAYRSLALGKVRKVNVFGVSIKHPVYAVRSHKRKQMVAAEKLWEFIQQNQSQLSEDFVTKLKNIS